MLTCMLSTVWTNNATMHMATNNLMLRVSLPVSAFVQSLELKYKVDTIMWQFTVTWVHQKCHMIILFWEINDSLDRCTVVNQDALKLQFLLIYILTSLNFCILLTIYCEMGRSLVSTRWRECGRFRTYKGDGILFLERRGSGEYFEIRVYSWWCKLIATGV